MDDDGDEVTPARRPVFSEWARSDASQPPQQRPEPDGACEPEPRPSASSTDAGALPEVGQEEEHFEVLPIGPDVGLTEVVRAAQSVDRSQPGWRPDVVASQAAEVIAEASPGASLAQFLEAEQAGLSDCPDEAMLIELIAASERMMAHYAAMQSDFIAELMMHRKNSLSGVSSVADEISARLAVTNYAAGAAVSRSMDLADSPTLRNGLRSGDLSARKVDVITDATSRVGPEEAVAITDYGVHLAPTHTPPQLKKALAAAVVAADAARAEERHDQEVARREVRLDPAPDGMAWLSLYTSAEDALSVFTCLDTLAAHTDADDARGIDARRADAMTGIFERIMSTGILPDGAAMPTVHGRRPHVRITATEPVLAGDATTPAVLHGYGPITAGTARSLAASGVIEAPTTGRQATTSQAGFARQTRSQDDPTAVGHASRQGHVTTTPPAETADQARKTAWTRAQIRALYDPDPMDEVIPRPRPPGQPDGADPGELAAWVGTKIGWYSRRWDGSKSGVPPGTAPVNPSKESPPGQAVQASESPPASKPATETRPVAESPVAVLDNELGIMATDAYAPSARLRALIVARDQTCRYPTCQVPAWRCQLDHIQAFDDRLPAWAQTTEANLHALCTHHHQRKTSGELTPERDTRTGVTTWRTPTGHLYTRPPEPADYTALASHLQHATQLVVCEPPPKPSVDPATLPTAYLAGEGTEPYVHQAFRRSAIRGAAARGATTTAVAGGAGATGAIGVTDNASEPDNAPEPGDSPEPYGEPPF